MKFIKRILLTILILTAVGILFRGGIYRSLITYNSVGPRTNYPASDGKLISYIEGGAKDLNNPEIQQIIKTGLKITSKQLNFTVANNDNDPNKLITSKTAHCIGYAAFFATTCNYLLEKYGFSENWLATPQIGQMYFIGANLHQYFNSPFFKDHDFVIIENKHTGEIFAVDPTVSDYLMVELITYKR